MKEKTRKQGKRSDAHLALVMDTDEFTKMMLLNISQKKEADAAVKQRLEQHDPETRVEDAENLNTAANKPTPPQSRRNKRLSNASASQAENQVITEVQHQVPPSPPTSRRRNRMVSAEEEEEEKVVQSPQLRPQNHIDPIIPAELNSASKKPAPPPHRHSKIVQHDGDGIRISPPPPPRSRQVTEDNGGGVAKLNRSKSLKVEGPPPPPPRGLRKAGTVQELSPPQISTESSAEAGGGGETDLSGALDDLQKEVDELLRQAQTRLNV